MKKLFFALLCIASFCACEKITSELEAEYVPKRPDRRMILPENISDIFFFEYDQYGRVTSFKEMQEEYSGERYTVSHQYNYQNCVLTDTVRMFSSEKLRRLTLQDGCISSYMIPGVYDQYHYIFGYNNGYLAYMETYEYNDWSVMSYSWDHNSLSGIQLYKKDGPVISEYIFNYSVNANPYYGLNVDLTHLFIYALEKFNDGDINYWGICGLLGKNSRMLPDSIIFRSYGYDNRNAFESEIVMEYKYGQNCLDEITFVLGPNERHPFPVKNIEIR